MCMLKMNEASGRVLYALCRENMNFMHSGMDYWDFIETVGIRPGTLEEYFKGTRDLPEEHFTRIAAVCRASRVLLRADLVRSYQKGEDKNRETAES